MMQTLKQQLTDLLNDLRFFPLFFAAYLIGFVRLFATSVDILSLALLAIMVALSTRAVIGVIVFLGGYVLLRSLDGIASGLHRIAATRDHQ